MNIIYKKIDEVIPYEKNPRKNDEAVKYVAESIKEFGFKVPIIIDSNNVIIAGHTRLKASKKLGYKEVPCIIADDLTPEQIKAFRLADNKVGEMAEWDLDLLNEELEDIIDINMEDFGFDLNLDFEDKEVEEDDFEIQVPEEPVAKLGDIWQLGEHRLMCGDSTDKETVSKLMDGKKADMVMTDPPYGMFLDTDFTKMSGDEGCGKKYDKVIGDNEDFNPELIKTVFDNFGYVKEIFLWGADYYAEHLKGKNNGSWIVWDKRENENTEKNVDNRFGSMFELCWSKEKHRREIIRFMWAGMMKQSDFDNGRNHPTQKPAKMLGNIIKDFSDNGNLIVDIYGGSGSTLIACEQLNRKCYMMELDPKYCDVIIKRWETLTGEKAVLLNN